MNPEGTVYNAMGRINRLSVLCIDAYGVAVKNGFEGTVEEWLASLHGKDGNDGYTPVRGVDYWTDNDVEMIRNDITNYNELRYIVHEMSGKRVIANNSLNLPLHGLKLFGESTQDGTPTMDNPVNMVNVEEQAVTIYGKNRLPRFTSTTVNGTTFTVNDDGSVSVTGTPTAMSRIQVNFNLEAGTYILSGAPKCSKNSYNDIYIGNAGTGETVARCYDGSVMQEFTLTERTSIRAYCRVQVGYSDFTFYPMIRLADDADETYEPYVAPQTVSFPYTLRGIDDARDYVDCVRGKLVRQVGVLIFDGSDDEVWMKTDATAKDRFYIRQTGVITNSRRGLSNMYTWAPISAYTNGLFWFTFNKGNNQWYVELIAGEHGTFADATAFKNWLKDNPIEIYYQLDTHEEIDLTEAEVAACKALSVNNRMTVFDATVDMKVGYFVDTTASIERKLTVYGNIAEMVACFTKEIGTCYVVNDDSYFCKGYKGNFYTFQPNFEFGEIELSNGGIAKLVIPEFTPIKSNEECVDTLIDIGYSYCGVGINYVSGNGPFANVASAYRGIQCSQFANALLQGLYYEDSRLVDPASDNPLCDGGCRWLDEDDYKTTDVGCLSAYELAHFAAAHGWLCKTQYLKDCEVGDVLFFANTLPEYYDTRWQGINHVAVVIGRKDGLVYCLQAGGISSINGLTDGSRSYYPKSDSVQAVNVQTILSDKVPFINGYYRLFGFARFPLSYRKRTEKESELIEQAFNTAV